MSVESEDIKEILEKQLEAGYKAAATGKTLEQAKQEEGLTGGQA